MRVFPGTAGRRPAARRCRRWPGGWSATATTCASSRGSRSSTARPTPSRSTGRLRRSWSAPRPGRLPATEVAGIHPTAAEVPRNLLRLLRLVLGADERGLRRRAGAARRRRRQRRSPGPCCPPSMSCGTLPAAGSPSCSTRPASSAAWPATSEAGYPLRPGEPFRLVVDGGFRDAQGLPLRAARAAAVPGRRRRAPPRRSRQLGADGPARRNVASRWRSPSTARSITACSPAACT